jgi:SAM-dependent methyltransferase
MSPLTDQARATARRLLRPATHEGWLRLPENRPSEQAVKPAPYLPIYEQLLAPLRRRSFALLELGVWNGHSLEMWRDAFPRATVVGIDLQPPDMDLGPRVHIVPGDQSDGALMQRVRDDYAPAGFDVIIDDASHIGVLTARSLQVLYAQHLRPGGLYCIEDWGTGYLLNWHDGGLLAAALDVQDLDTASTPTHAETATPTPMPSHEFGVVGLVKRLIDHAASGTVRFAQPDMVGETLSIESMGVWDGIVALRKPS